MRSTFKYIVFLNSLLWLVLCQMQAQDSIPNTNKSNKKWFYGLAIELDAASVISLNFIKSDTYTTQGGLQFNIVDKYFPCIELGYGGANKTTESLVEFSGKSAFARLGVDFNLLKPNIKASKNLFLVGVRVGSSKMKYSVKNVQINDGYWGGTETKDFLNIPTFNTWLELSAGIQVEVIKPFYMGWRVRNKSLLSKTYENEISPWYIPGFGINNGSQWEFNYNIGIKF